MRTPPAGQSTRTVRNPVRHRGPVVRLVAALVLVAVGLMVTPLRAASTAAQRDEPLTIRGREQVLHLYGSPGGEPVVIASGDGGWVHLAPHLAEFLAARGYFVVGVDSRAYLESFTSTSSSLAKSDVPGDFRVVLARAMGAADRKPALIGVSEGAGLAVLAAGDPGVQHVIRGVLVVGLPDLNELAWRWRDDLIYVTHGVPNEPLFSAAAAIARVAPVPVAGIYASHDEFVPEADARRVADSAGEPKRFWTVPAANHRFSDNLNELDTRLADALAWMSGPGR
ncbi:MAG: alpha/beta hydrolase [Acidobacteriota bacterium]